MGPCMTCGQQTEPDVGYCPECAGYPAQPTIYSYAPDRLSNSDRDLPPELAAISLTTAPGREGSAGAAESERWPIGSRPGSATLGTAQHETWRADELPAEPSPHGNDGFEDQPAVVARRPSWAEEVAARLRASSDRRWEARWIVATATLIVLIVAAGTVALALVRPRPASGPAPPRIPHISATSSPAPSASADILVTLAESAAASPYQAGVRAFVSQYFAAINRHDFAAYERLFGPALRANLSATAFGSGYGTTTDTRITLHTIGVLGASEVVAQVTFISHQQPAASPTNSACTAWNVSLFLVRRHGGYLLQQPPAWYQASFTACS